MTAATPLCHPAGGAPEARAAATLKRRLACFVYEGLIVFGVVMAVGLVYGVAVGQHDASMGRHGLQGAVFVALGTYFVWFWSHGGQTVAMKAWRIRLLSADGAPVPAPRCALRYLLAWLWFAPALATLALSGLPGAMPSLALIALGALAYALLARLHPDRQFLHDIVCGTRLVDWHESPAGRRGRVR